MEVDLRIEADGTRCTIEPVNEEYYTKEELQAYVGGSIIIYRLDDGYMFANPDGESLRLPYNGHGTNILIDHGYPHCNARGVIVLADTSHVDLTKLLNTVTVAEP